MVETTDVESRRANRRKYKMIFRMISAVGIGLGMAAIWWEYSDRLINRLLAVIGLA